MPGKAPLMSPKKKGKVGHLRPPAPVPAPPFGLLFDDDEMDETLLLLLVMLFVNVMLLSGASVLPLLLLLATVDELKLLLCRKSNALRRSRRLVPVVDVLD